MGGSGLQSFAVLIVLFILACGAFSIYFVFKQVQFIIQAVNLYKRILNREDAIIKLLIDIRDNTKTYSGISSVSETDDGDVMPKEYKYGSNSQGQSCIHCGAKLSPGDEFCPACGKRRPASANETETKYTPPEVPKRIV